MSQTTTPDEIRQSLFDQAFWDQISNQDAPSILPALIAAEKTIVREQKDVAASLKQLPPQADDRHKREEKSRLNRERRMVTKRKVSVKGLQNIMPKDSNGKDRELFVEREFFEAITLLRREVALAGKLRQAILKHKQETDDAGIDPEVHDIELWQTLEERA